MFCLKSVVSAMHICKTYAKHTIPLSFHVKFTFTQVLKVYYKYPLT